MIPWTNVIQYRQLTFFNFPLQFSPWFPAETKLFAKHLNLTEFYSIACRAGLGENTNFMWWWPDVRGFVRRPGGNGTFSDIFRCRYLNLGNFKLKIYCTILFFSLLIIQRYQTGQFDVSLNLHVTQHELMLLNSVFAHDRKGSSTRTSYYLEFLSSTLQFKSLHLHLICNYFF